MKRNLIILTIVFLFNSCHLDKDNFLDKKSADLKDIISKDFSKIKKGKKDTLVLDLSSHDWCGTNNTVYIDTKPFLPTIKERANSFGFSTVILDTQDIFVFENRNFYKGLPKYHFYISIHKDFAFMVHSYSTFPQDKEVFISQDTTISF